MAHESNESRSPKKKAQARHPSDPVVRERVQELTWALVDEQILDDEMRLLENLMLSDEEARGTYIGCVQLHADLISHFSDKAAAAQSTATKSPVLGFLNEGTPAVELQSPPSEDAKL